MATEVDYSHTAAGILGTHRESMLQNQLLLRPQLGKPLKRGYSLPSAQFTFGRPNGRTDGGTAVAMGGWSTESAGKQPTVLQLRGKNRRDMIDMDKPPMTAPEFTDLASTRKLADERRKQRNKLPASMVFGICTRPSTPVFDLLEHKYQDKWLDERRSEGVAKMLKEQSKKSTSGKVYETRASLLRSYQHPIEQKSPLWQLPKFTRHARPALQTFRTDRSRSAAYQNYQSDSIARKGTIGHGIYDTAVN